MDDVIGYLFRFLMYAMFGLSMETVFSIYPIELVLGTKVRRRVPFKYLEGFVSAYMIPLHGLGLLIFFEPGSAAISSFHPVVRFAIYAIGITLMEVLWGWLCDRTLGFYSWDYYATSRYRIFKRGYSLWTLVPCWGAAGMLLEVYTDLMIILTPHVVSFFA
jgi:hypothetical protein